MANSLIDLLGRQAARHPERTSFRFLVDGDINGRVDEWTYRDLERRARTIGVLLQQEQKPGSRVLLLHPPGLDFLAGFLGCAFAGMVAVPAHVPDSGRPERTLPRLARIVVDCDASAVLTTGETRPLSQQAELFAPPLANLRWLSSDGLPDAAHGDLGTAASGPEDLALLQYTSGSTGPAKGVMVTHANLLHNLRSMNEAWRQGEHSQIVSWLPPYHDMGLVGGLLYTVFLGATGTLMTPLAFVQKPSRWVEAISRFRGTLSLAPNFAYDLCALKMAASDAEALDLSSWEVAGNGAEPVRRETMDRFTDRFAPSSFRGDAFRPCYGLAEGTLFVTAGRSSERPTGEAAQTRHPVSCGRPASDTEVVVVDPETLERCADGRTGEIWIKSHSNAVGYWNRPADTEGTFRARLVDDGPYLRTGDLGYLEQGELYIGGRIKDLVIVHGVNHYPQDIEFSVERCHRSIRSGCVAAFGIEEDGQERLVVVAEVDDGFEGGADEVAVAIRSAIAAEHQLRVHDIALVSARTIPKTSSGKIRRRESHDRYLGGRLARRAFSDRPPRARTAEEIRAWLVAQVARRVNIEPGRVATGQPFDIHGLSSLDAVGMSGDLALWLGRPLVPTVVYAHPTIDALAQHLSKPSFDPAGSPAAVPGREADAPQPPSRTCRRTSPSPSSASAAATPVRRERTDTGHCSATASTPSATYHRPVGTQTTSSVKAVRCRGRCTPAAAPSWTT